MMSDKAMMSNKASVTETIDLVERRPLIAGNWKMNLNHLEAIAVTQKLVYSLEEKDFEKVEVAVFPPFTDIRSIQTLVDGDRLRISYGAQDLSPEKNGAFTGDISAAMLEKLGCTYVIIGHSERRAVHGESDELINRKIKAATHQGISPILCVGEELDVREAGRQIEHVITQLRAALKGVHKPDLKKIVFAYEPVWAIGTGRTATPEDAEEVCSAIRTELRKMGSDEIAENARILYGGSVKSANIVDIMRKPNVTGALVGGASLDPEEFARICKFHRVI
jgi:triosephosphate isomerase